MLRLKFTSKISIKYMLRLRNSWQLILQVSAAFYRKLFTFFGITLCFSLIKADPYKYESYIYIHINMTIHEAIAIKTKYSNTNSDL